MTDSMPTLEYWCPVHEVYLSTPNHYLAGGEKVCQEAQLSVQTLTQLLLYRTGSEFDYKVSPSEATHVIEIASGQIIEYPHGDKEPEGFDPKTQFWVKVKKKH